MTDPASVESERLVRARTPTQAIKTSALYGEVNQIRKIVTNVRGCRRLNVDYNFGHLSTMVHAKETLTALLK
jgi:hypothetical protein